MEVLVKMKNRLGMYLAIAGMLLLGSCAVTDVSQDVDFNQSKTFAFDKARVNVNDPAYKKRIDQFEDPEECEGGIRETRVAVFEKGSRSADKRYETFTQQKEQMSASGYGNPYFGFGQFYRPFGPYMWGYPYMPYAPMGGVYQYTEGTLIIDVTDAKSNEHIWRGLVKRCNGRQGPSEVARQGCEGDHEEVSRIGRSRRETTGHSKEANQLAFGTL